MRHELSTGSLVKLMSFLFWNWIYIVTVDGAPGKSPEWCSRVVTLLHSSIATLGGLSQCKCSSSPSASLWNVTMRTVLPYQYLLMIWSWGYFAFDLLWCLVYWTDSIIMLCHHSCALFAITRYMQKGQSGLTYACTLVLLEITNPILQIRWFLKDSGYGKTKLYYIVEMAYLSMFLFLRAIVGTILMIWIFMHSSLDLEEKLLSLLFYGVSMVFVYDIACYIRYRYKNELTDFRTFYYGTSFPDDMFLEIKESIASATTGTSKNINKNVMKDELDKSHYC